MKRILFAILLAVAVTACYDDTDLRNQIEKNKQAYKSPIYNEYLYNKPEPTSPFCSAYTFNTNYTAPVINLKMKQYVPLTYQYVIAVDYLPVMRAQFKNVYEKEGITNESLNAWR